jgi:hypothetical protein
MGQHVKVRHVKQLAEQFMEEAQNMTPKGSELVSSPFLPCTIQEIMRCHKVIRIYSRVAPKAFYLFGVVGKYFEEGDDDTNYITHENMEQHSIYLGKVLSHISLHDFFKKSMIYGTVMRENRILKDENLTLVNRVKNLTFEVQRLKEYDM